MEVSKLMEEGLGEGREEEVRGPEVDDCAIIKELSKDMAAVADNPEA